MATSESPVPYPVHYSGAVLEHFRLLARQATARGDGPVFTDALKEFHGRLALYPQFGDPIIDLALEAGQIRVGVIRPISMRYAVYEVSRLVVCAALPILLPMDSPDAEAAE